MVDRIKQLMFMIFSGYILHFNGSIVTCIGHFHFTLTNHDYHLVEGFITDKHFCLCYKVIVLNTT
jgi:hypothetical protein